MPDRSYPGNPGNPEDPEAIVPERDLKPMMDEADQILASIASGEALPGGPGGPGGLGGLGIPVEEAAEDMIGDAEDADLAAAEGEAVSADVQGLADMLQIDAVAAQSLYDAAQSLGRTRGMSHTELGELLLEDFQLRMELERIAGGVQDDAAALDAEAMLGAPELPLEPVAE